MSAGLQKRMRAQRRKEFRMLLRQPGLLLTILVILAILIVFCIYPVLRLFVATVTNAEGQFDLASVVHVVQSTNFGRSLLNSILLGAAVSIAATLIGFLFAYAITRTEMRGKRFFNIMAMLPIISPPFVISLAMILLFGRSGLISKTCWAYAGQTSMALPASPWCKPSRSSPWPT